MKILYFMKIDYIWSRAQLYWILAALTFVTLIMRFMTDSSDVSVFMYGVFIAIVVSTVPFGNCRRADAGFLQLLPATTWQRVLGRFLFGLCLLLAGSAISIGCTVLHQMFVGSEMNLMALPFYMIFSSIGLVIIAAEYILLYMIGENHGAQFLSLVRMIPGMAFFFGFTSLINTASKNPSEAMRYLDLISGRLDVISWGCVVFALAVMAFGVILCAKVTGKRDC